jgi:TolB-like protein
LQALKKALTALALVLCHPQASHASRGDCASVAGDLARAAVKFAKKRVAVAPFVGPRGRESFSGSVVSERLISHLLGQGTVDVVERTLLNSVMREQKLERFGLVDPRTVKTLGKVLGVEAIISGTVVELRDGRVELNARLVDAETAKVLAATTVSIEKEWSEFSPEEVLNVPVPELPDFEVAVNSASGDLRDAIGGSPLVPGSSACGSSQGEVDEIERSIVDLKARYWASKLKDPSFSSRSLKHNPGSEIDNPEIKARFYSQMRLWYDDASAPPMTSSEITILNQQEKRIRELADACKSI